MQKKSKFEQGFFRPKHPEKYNGNPRGIVYRSSYEKKLMIYLDRKESIIEWESEELFIPYRNPFDGRIHRYFPDFKLKVKDKDGNITTHLWEVKPKKFTIRPNKKRKKTKSLIYETAVFAINKKKWIAAEEYCKVKGWQWRIITEDDLAILV